MHEEVVPGVGRTNVPSSKALPSSRICSHHTSSATGHPTTISIRAVDCTDDVYHTSPHPLQGYTTSSWSSDPSGKGLVASSMAIVSTDYRISRNGSTRLGRGAEWIWWAEIDVQVVVATFCDLSWIS